MSLGPVDRRVLDAVERMGGELVLDREHRQGLVRDLDLTEPLLYHALGRLEAGGLITRELRQVRRHHWVPCVEVTGTCHELDAVENYWGTGPG